MDKIYLLLPYTAGLMLLLLVIAIDMAAVRLIFGDATSAMLIGLFLVLESLFFLYYNLLPLNGCSPRGIKRWTRRFYRLFVAMGACSATAFAAKVGGWFMLMPLLELVFWGLAVALLVIGAGMGLCVLGIHGDDDADGTPPASPPSMPLYGRAGYGARS